MFEEVVVEVPRLSVVDWRRLRFRNLPLPLPVLRPRPPLVSSLFSSSPSASSLNDR